MRARSPWKRGSLVACVVGLWLLLPGSIEADGPTLRADVIARQQAEKAQQLRAYEPTRPERVVMKIQETFLEPASGFYPLLDSVYGGGGFTPGVGYRRFYGDRSVWSVHGLYSVKNYKLVEIGTTSPGHLLGRLDFELRAGWRDATRVGYYGIGTDTPRESRANYRFQQAYAGGSAVFRPTWWTVVAGGLTFEDYTLKRGQGDAPSIEQAYAPDAVPGFDAEPAYVHTQASAGIDWRTSPGYSRTGGYYGLTLHDFADVADSYGFRRLDAHVVQHVPVLKETWVLSLRGRLQTTLDDSDVVPYFMLPSLGSGSTLRGYATGRFRDRHSLLTSAEWRWFPSRLALDVALFVDAGKVASRRADLDLDGLKANWGIGARFHGPTLTPVRVELARGSDGWKLVFASHAAF